MIVIDNSEQFVEFLSFIQKVIPDGGTKLSFNATGVTCIGQTEDTTFKFSVNSKCARTDGGEESFCIKDFKLKKTIEVLINHANVTSLNVQVVNSGRSYTLQYNDNSKGASFKIPLVDEAILTTIGKAVAKPPPVIADCETNSTIITKLSNICREYNESQSNVYIKPSNKILTATVSTSSNIKEEVGIPFSQKTGGVWKDTIISAKNFKNFGLIQSDNIKLELTDKNSLQATVTNGNLTAYIRSSLLAK